MSRTQSLLNQINNTLNNICDINKRRGVITKSKETKNEEYEEYNTLLKGDNSENHDLHDIYSSYKNEPRSASSQVCNPGTSSPNESSPCPNPSLFPSCQNTPPELPLPGLPSGTSLKKPPEPKSAELLDPGGGIGTGSSFSLPPSGFSSNDLSYAETKADISEDEVAGEGSYG